MRRDAFDELRRDNPVSERLPAPAIEPLLRRLELEPEPTASRPSRLKRMATAVRGVGAVSVRLGGQPGAPRVGVLGPILATVVTIAVVIVAMTTLRHGHTPVSRAPAPARTGPLLPTHLSHRQGKELDYIEKAYGAAVRADQGCIGTRRLLAGRSYTISEGSPSQRLLSILGVLRRPADSADKLPTRITYHPYRVQPNGSLPSFHDIYVHYIRRARSRFGAGYYVVPAANVNSTDPLPERCYREQRAALRRQLPHIPSGLRAGTLALEPAFLNSLRQSSRPYAGVCVLALNDTGNGDGCGRGYSVSDIEQGHTLSSGGPTGVGVVYGLVPDGVATVTLFYRKHGHTLKITANAISNIFIVHNPSQRLPDYGLPTKMVWRTATGTVLKTVS